MKKIKNMSTDKLFKFFVYSALFTLAVSIIIPVAWVFMASIKENSEFYANPWNLPLGVHFDNFRIAFVEAKMGEYFMNSVIATTIGLVVLLVVALPAAYVLARFNFKGKKFVDGMLMAGLFVNVNYIVVPIFLMLLGADNMIYDLIEQELVLNNIFVLGVVYAATAIPFTVYLLSSFFRTLPKAYEEAAEIDGCGYFKTMTKVMIPLAMPSIVTVLLFNFLAFWNEYILALTLNPSSGKTLPVGLMSLMQASRGKAEYGVLYAGLVIVMLPTLILYILVQKKLTQGMTMGGLKD